MASLLFVNRIILLSFGPFHLILGLIGAIMQVFILTSVPYYRRTPCTFYFIIASIHECGEFITSSGPIVFAAFFNIDMMRVSAAWCRLRFFFATSFASVPLTCACLATIDQYLITSTNNRFREWSNIKYAHRISLFSIIIWWLHGILYVIYQDISPITGVCFYISNAFFAYAIIFLCAVLCGMHILIMTIFGFLAYRNMKSIMLLSRLRVDRQLTILVFIQIFLTLVGLTPYGLFSTYRFITINVEKTVEQQIKDLLAGNITYLLGSLTYGGRFYVFLCSSRRFRRIVKDRIFWWQRQIRINPQGG